VARIPHELLPPIKFTQRMVRYREADLNRYIESAMTGRKEAAR
jgi:hypothetical protein